MPRQAAQPGTQRGSTRLLEPQARAWVVRPQGLLLNTEIKHHAHIYGERTSRTRGLVLLMLIFLRNKDFNDCKPGSLGSTLTG